jgi:glycosyltransferase involved in cell wall biosynthesis
MKVLFLNDYPMAKARDLNLQGLYPSQHLWGMGEIHQFGYEPVYFPDKTWAGEPSRYKFSIQQIQTLVESRGCDVVYSACQFNTWLLARMRRAGLLRKPLVTLVHHPLKSVLQGAGYVSGHDALVFLNESVENQSKQRFGGRLAVCSTLPWGPDLAFCADLVDADRPMDIDVVAAGKTNRDFATLINASRNRSWQVLIYCADRNLNGIGSIPENVSVRSNQSGIVLNYRELYEVSARARIIAVPMFEIDALAGLTSVVDAIALGKPLVMTKNKWLDLDPEAEGFGITVAAGDVQGWTQAVDTILNDADLQQRMARNAQRVAASLNMTNFARDLSKVFDRVLKN